MRATALFVILGAVGAAGGADGTVTGFGRYAKLIDRPGAGYVELYEWNLFLSPFGGSSTGPSRRLGAPPGEPPRHDGYYAITAPAGRCSLYLAQPLFYARPAVVPSITLEAGTTTTQHVGPAMDFCCYHRTDWDPAWHDRWYQTFVARGTSITGVSFVVAGTAADRVEVAVLAVVTGVPPSGWGPVSAAAVRSTGVAPLADNWVRWRSGDVPTVPGRTYAVRLRGASGDDRTFTPCSRPKDGQSYPDGRGYRGDEPKAYDLNVTVFSDSDGLLVTMCKTTTDLGELRDGYYGGRWGQTFKAGGTSLAAVDVWAAGADRHWDLDFTFSVREGGPQGKRIGPIKTTKAAYQAFGAGLHAVSYNPGEVPLAAGSTYYVEFTNAEGFNPYVMNRAEDAYASGAAYQDGVLKDGGGVDLAMTILEYAPAGGAIEGTVRSAAGPGLAGVELALDPGAYRTESGADGSFLFSSVPAGTYAVQAQAEGFNPATVQNVAVVEEQTTTITVILTPAPCASPFRNGGFEDGLSAWTLYGGAKSNVIVGPWFAEIVARQGSRFQGNEVNGNALPPGGLYQRFCVEPGRRYRGAAWSNVYWIGGTSRGARGRVGLDPAGGTSPAAGSVVWSPWHEQPREATAGWAQLIVECQAAGTTLTLFLDFLQEDAAGSRWHINCFDGASIEDLAPPDPSFRRGDCNDDAAVDVSDAVCVLSHLFAAVPVHCEDALDGQDDGKVDIADAVFLLQYLFGGGAQPPPPGVACGTDPTPDDLTCGETSC